MFLMRSFIRFTTHFSWIPFVLFYFSFTELWMCSSYSEYFWATSRAATRNWIVCLFCPFCRWVKSKLFGIERQTFAIVCSSLKQQQQQQQWVEYALNVFAENAPISICLSANNEKIISFFLPNILSDCDFVVVPRFEFSSSFRFFF